MKCCICGPVKNCGPFLDKVFDNIEKIGELFEDYVIIIYYDKSSDNTLQKLQAYQVKNPKLLFYVNTGYVSKFRTHNIARGRNFCIKKIFQEYLNYDYFIMMDFDDVNCKDVHLETLKKYLKLEVEDWDSLSFNTDPNYRDIWGLSIKPYTFSYNHFNNNVGFYYVIQKYVEEKLNKLREGELLPCISAFNGFAIYKIQKCLACYYDGRIRLDLLPKKYLLKHSKATNSPIIFKDYGNVNGNFEDCEHRAFHVMMINKHNAKIRISKDILFK